MTDKPTESELLELRKAKLDELRASGNAFPNKFKRFIQLQAGLCFKE